MSQNARPLDPRLVPAALAARLVAWRGGLLPHAVLLVLGLTLGHLDGHLLVRRANECDGRAVRDRRRAPAAGGPVRGLRVQVGEAKFAALRAKVTV